MIRKVLIAIGAVFAVGVGVLTIGPSLIPSGTLKAQIEAHASEALGRRVSIDGAVRVRLLPSIEVRAGATEIANAAGFGDAPIAAMDELRVKVGLFSLLGGTVSVEEFVLVEPRLDLETLANGANNWTLAPAGGSGAGGVVDRSGVPAPDDVFVRQAGVLPIDARLGDVRIVNGRAVLRDGATGTVHDIRGVDVTVRLDSVDGPLSLEAGFVLDGVKHDVSARIDSLRGLLEGALTPLSLRYDSGLARLDIDGAVLEGPMFDFEGETDLLVPSVRALAAAGGTVLPDGDVYGRARVRGLARGNAGGLHFSEAQVSIDDIEARGDITVSLAGARPMITGALRLGDADVTPYAPAAPEGETTRGEDDAGWGDEPLDLSALNLVDADLALTIGEVTYGSVTVGPGATQAVIDRGRLALDLTGLTAYGGQIAGGVVANGRSSPSSFSLDVTVADVQAAPLLDAMAGFGQLAGRGDIEISLTTSGASVDDLMNGLRGGGRFSFADGMISGADFEALAAGLQTALDGDFSLAGFSQARGETSFEALAARFTLDEGLAKTQDFSITTEGFSVSGVGELNIAEQTLRLSFTPTSTAPAGTSHLPAALANAGVPIVLTGQWGSVSVGVDQDALATLARQAAGGALTDALSDQLGDDAGALVGGLLSGETRGDQAAGALLRALGGGGDTNDED